MLLDKDKEPVEFSLQINKELQQVRVVPKKTRGGYLVEIGDRRFEVDLCPHMDLDSFIVSVDRCPYDVSLTKIKEPNKILIDDEEVDFSLTGDRIAPFIDIPSPRIEPTKEKVQPVEIKDPGRTITAPMPGVVLLLNVEVGQNVSKGDLLLIFEAMKMENRIESPRNGVVKEIFVKGKGDRINRLDPLFVIE